MVQPLENEIRISGYSKQTLVKKFANLAVDDPQLIINVPGNKNAIIRFIIVTATTDGLFDLLFGSNEALSFGVVAYCSFILDLSSAPYFVEGLNDNIQLVNKGSAPIACSITFIGEIL